MNDEPSDPQAVGLIEAARLMRAALAALPPGDDSPRDAAVRRRIEGAIAAAELAAGEPAPRRAGAPESAH